MNEESMNKGNFNHLTTEQKAELQALVILPEEQIKIDDLSEVRDWSGGKRGIFYRPVKQKITLNIDADILEWFKANQPRGKGYQAIINQALREYVRQHQP
jgi:uncharacterized protein (DUF4415 family)